MIKMIHSQQGLVPAQRLKRERAQAQAREGPLDLARPLRRMQCARSVGSRRDQARWRRWRAPASASATCARRARSTRKQARRRLGRAARTSHSKSASVGGWMPEALSAAVGGRRRAQPVIAVLFFFFFFFCVLRSRCASRAKDVWCGRAALRPPNHQNQIKIKRTHTTQFDDKRLFLRGNDVLSWHARTRVTRAVFFSLHTRTQRGRLCSAFEAIARLGTAATTVSGRDNKKKGQKKIFLTSGRRR